MASDRVLYQQSFSELNGVPTNSSEWYLPWYDKASCGMVSDNVHIANAATYSNGVYITMPCLPQTHITLAPGQGGYVSYAANTMCGPIHIVGTGGLVATERVQYYNSFQEVTGIPALAASTRWYLNWVDALSPGSVNDNIHIVNPNSVTVSGHVTIGSSSWAWSAAPYSYAVVSPNTIGGAIVQADGGYGVLVSHRSIYQQSFAQTNAMSGGSSQQYFNWYDNTGSFSSDNIHFTDTSGAANQVCVIVPGFATQCSPGVSGYSASYVSMPSGTMGGPVTVYSPYGRSFVASERVQYANSRHEVNSLGSY